MKFVVGVAMVGVIGCASGTLRKSELRGASTETLLAAVDKRDAKAIEAMLEAPLTFAGLYFVDTECARKFPAPRKLQAADLPAFATCLATLPLEASPREDAMFGVSVLRYPPGLEIEVMFRFRDEEGKVAWIGYAGRRDIRDGLPTITPEALEALRVEGDRKAPPTAAHAAQIEAESREVDVPFGHAWMKVCLDAEGRVTGVHPRQVTSPAAAAGFAEAIRGWRFRPFRLGTQALPVCSLLVVSHPWQELDEKQLLPITFPIDDGAIIVAPTQLKRISGLVAIQPDAPDRARIGRGTVTASFRYCIDESGNVSQVAPVEPTGLPSYDAKLAQGIAAWRYKPFAIGGKPIKACSAVTFHFKGQRRSR